MNYVHLVTVMCLISHNPSECCVSHIIAVWNFAMRRCRSDFAARRDTPLHHAASPGRLLEMCTNMFAGRNGKCSRRDLASSCE
ncbi:hypothetical protein K1T71_008846 [Dendrolimus kikuchii]|uniref:Uncharacterized protein n=1 Tax=Dendrolimus kikuchii TaxID=765133 RepID=A0ACC1CX38_9NEOP|nr:hypothetical protein K1T71_008846 [Dendrolimus kikuchii]